MKTLEHCLEKVSQNVNIYYFLVEYKFGGNPTKLKNLIYAQETLDFYRSLPDDAQPEIWFYLEVIIEGERFQAKKRLTEQDCERLVYDDQFTQEVISSLRIGVASRVMLER